MGTPHPKSNDESLELHNRFLRAFADRSKQTQKMSDDEASRLTQLSVQFESASHAVPTISIYETQKTRLGSWFLTKKLMVGLFGMHLKQYSLTLNLAPRERPRSFEFATRTADSHERVTYRPLLHSA